MAVSEFIKKLTEREFGPCIGSKIKIGDIMEHESGKTAKITGGKFWSKYGVSNYWYWMEIKKDGTEGKVGYGYGTELKQLRGGGDI